MPRSAGASSSLSICLNSCWALRALGRRLLVLFPQAVSPLPPMRAAVLLRQDPPGADAASPGSRPPRRAARRMI